MMRWTGIREGAACGRGRVRGRRGRGKSFLSRTPLGFLPDRGASQRGESTMRLPARRSGAARRSLRPVTVALNLADLGSEADGTDQPGRRGAGSGTHQ